MKYLIFFLLLLYNILFSYNIELINNQYDEYTPNYLIWSYTYTDINGNDLDTNNIDFYIYYSNNIIQNYNLLGITSDTSYYFRNHEFLYDSTTLWYFYVKAHRKDNELFSSSSDTVFSVFYKNTTNISTINKYKYKISKNYPNPFNNYTIIDIENNLMTNLNLLIYNINGKIIQKILINSGKTKVIIKFNTESAGIYFYKLQEFNESNKIIYIK